MNGLRQRIADRDSGLAALSPKPTRDRGGEDVESLPSGFVRTAILTYLGLCEDDLALCANCKRQSWRHDELGACPE